MCQSMNLSKSIQQFWVAAPAFAPAYRCLYWNPASGSRWKRLDQNGNPVWSGVHSTRLAARKLMCSKVPRWAARFNMRCTWGERLKATLTFWAVNNFHWGACLAQRFLLAQYWWVFACCFNFHFFLCGFDLQMWITLNGNLFAPKIKTKANFAAEWSALLRFSPCNWQLLAQQRFRLAQTTVAGSLQIPLLDSKNIKAHHQTWSNIIILQPLCVLFGNYIVSMCFNVIGCRMIRMFEQVMDE